MMEMCTGFSLGAEQFGATREQESTLFLQWSLDIELYVNLAGWLSEAISRD